MENSEPIDNLTEGLFEEFVKYGVEIDDIVENPNQIYISIPEYSDLQPEILGSLSYTPKRYAEALKIRFKELKVFGNENFELKYCIRDNERWTLEDSEKNLNRLRRVVKESQKTNGDE